MSISPFLHYCPALLKSADLHAEKKVYVCLSFLATENWRTFVQHVTTVTVKYCKVTEFIIVLHYITALNVMPLQLYVTLEFITASIYSIYTKFSDHTWVAGILLLVLHSFFNYLHDIKQKNKKNFLFLPVQLRYRKVLDSSKSIEVERNMNITFIFIAQKNKVWW